MAQLTDSKILEAVKVDIGKVRIADCQFLATLNLDSPRDRVKFLGFCHDIVEGGIIQYFSQSEEVLSGVFEKISTELQTHSQLISGIATWFTENYPAFVHFFEEKE